jgi:hypothetical protein
MLSTLEVFMIQKILGTLLTYIIGVQMVLSVVPHHAFTSVAQAQSCSSGLQWNEMLGRCLTTAQASQLKDASKMCESKGDEAAKRQCYRDVVDGKMKDEGVAGAGKISMNMLPMIMAMASLASAALFLIKGGPSNCPGATSAYLIIGSALAVMAGEVLSASTYKSKLKKAEEKFKAVADSSKSESSKSSTTSTSDNSSATSAQAEAFQAMIELEEATISAAKTKNMLYMVATAGYAAATVMSTIETISWSTALGTPAAGAVIPPLTCTNASAYVESEKTELQYAANENKTKSLAEIYVDNYFSKSQRVDFHHYSSTFLIQQSSNIVNLGYANLELGSIRNGANQSPSIVGYEKVKTHLFKTHQKQDEFSLMKLASVMASQFTINSAQAMDFIPLAAMAAGIGAIALVGEGTILQKLYITPMSRAVLAGIMTVNNLFMIGKTNKEKKKAQERKEFIEKLKAQVEAAGSEFGCANNDRNNMAKPNCYCYSESGTLNPARSASATCKNLFGSKATLASKSGTNADGISTDKNCVANNGTLDSSCSCRQTNSCVTVKSPSVIGNVPAGNVLGNLPQTLNGLNSGALSAADIDGAAMTGLAARLSKMNDNLLADPKNKSLALQAKKSKAQAEKIMKDMERRLAGSSGALASNSNGSSFMNASSPAAALEEMKKDLTQQIKGYEGNVVPVAGGAAGKRSDDFSLDALNGGAGGVTVADEQLAEVMNSEYNMGDSDINTNSDANIFNILSHRYQRSGMRRLFGGEALVPAEKPADSEINR